MQIVKTVNSHSYNINAIFRDGQIYAEGQIQILVQKQGTLDIKTFTPAVIEYRPNYAVITINLTDEPSNYTWKDGEEYMIKVIDMNNVLIYMDTIYVSANGFDSKKQNIPNTDYTTVYDIQTEEQRDEQEIADDYIILND